MLHPNAPPLDWYINNSVRDAQAHLGMLPSYITSASADPIWMQIDEHSESGWNPQIVLGMGWELTADEYLIYQGLPPLAPAGYAYHLGEKVLAYPAGWVCIVQLGGKFSVARVR
jgi:hypothetical protein